jgi:hypothetical protein
MKRHLILPILFVISEVSMTPTLGRAQGFMPEVDPKKWEAASNSVPIKGLQLGKTIRSELASILKAKVGWTNVTDGSDGVCIQAVPQKGPMVVIMSEKGSDIISSVEIFTEKPDSFKSCLSSVALVKSAGKLWTGLKSEELEGSFGHPQLKSEKGLKFSFQNKKERLVIDVGLKDGHSDRLQIRYSRVE